MAVDFSKEMLETITEIVLNTISTKKKVSEKEKRDWRLRNTKLLLRNYHILKEHCEEIEIELISYEPLEFIEDKIEIESILISKEKTRRMVLYIDSMIAAYERYSKKAGEAARRRYKALHFYYITENGLSHSEIAEWLNIHERTVRRDLEEATKEFSVFLFGILSIEDIIE